MYLNIASNITLYDICIQYTVYSTYIYVFISRDIEAIFPMYIYISILQVRGSRAFS